MIVCQYTNITHSDNSNINITENSTYQNDKSHMKILIPAARNAIYQNVVSSPGAIQ